MVQFFSIGMTKSQAMAKLGSTQATEKTKQFIQNFWNTDKDGKISNEIELTMLESWASGSERVKMPTKGKGNKPLHTNIFSDGTTTEYWESQTNKRPIPSDVERATYDRLSVIKTPKSSTGMSSVSWCDGKVEDRLLDLDNDGYADEREYKDDCWSVKRQNEDKNLDGNLEQCGSKNKIQKSSLLGEPISYENVDITF